MKRARELVVALSNPDFKISLSCCYNYTYNYNKNTMEVIQHHDGKNINAKISLHNAPRIRVEKFVINIHWSSENVNVIADDTVEPRISGLVRTSVNSPDNRESG